MWGSSHGVPNKAVLKRAGRTVEDIELISKIHSATVVVADQEKALDFYVNKLGWEKGLDNQMGEMRYLTVVPPGAETQLVLGHTSWYADGEVPAKVGISLNTPDIDDTYATLTARGVTFKQPVEVMPWGQKATWLYDIDGNEYFLAEE